MSTRGCSREGLEQLLDHAQKLKADPSLWGSPLAGKTVALVFFNPSLRTRVSMAVAVRQLGGHPLVIEANRETWKLEFTEGAVMDADRAEHAKDAIAVLSGYVDALAVRCFPAMVNWADDLAEPVLSSFQRWSSVPVINLESATEHPLQAVADLLTMREKLGQLQGQPVTLCWARHPRVLPTAVPNSFALAAAHLGMDLTIASPPEYRLAPEIMDQVSQLAQQNGGQVRSSEDLADGCRGSRIVYAKSWASPACYGMQEEDLKTRAAYSDWTVTDSVMEETDGGYFMHCLPVRRNVVVADSVIDGPCSIVLQQAANRLHAQRALLDAILG